MGRRDLPDMYAQSLRAEGMHIRQIPTAHVTLKSKLKPTITLICCAYIKNARFTYAS